MQKTFRTSDSAAAIRLNDGMMAGLWRALRRLAGVDETILADCPRFDRIWATQIGFQLLLTFVFVFATVYISIDYINSAAVAPSADGGLQLLTNSKPPWLVAFGIGIAALVAGCVFLFDRAIFQSDWFHQLPFKGPTAGHSDQFALLGDAVRFYAGKSFRVVIRLVVSLAVAYSLSTFLELRVFESLIIGEMQRAHLEENAAAYQGLSEAVAAIDAELAAQSADLGELREAERRLLGTLSIPESAAFEQADARLDSLAERGDRRLAEIDRLEQAALVEPRQRRDAIRERLDASDARLAGLWTRIQAEIAGNPETLDNITGLPGCGPACAYYQAQYDDEARRRDAMLAEVSAIDGEIASLIADYDGRREAVAADSATERGLVTGQREVAAASLAAQRDQVLAEKQDNLKLLRQQIQSNEAALAVAQASRGDRVAELERSLSTSPQFVQFRDGPLDRLRAFEALKSDERYGGGIAWFGLVAMLFVMFIEVVPVATKLFFSPPSVYAIRLQAAVITESAAAKEGTAEAALNHEIELERMRKELQELQSARKMAESLHRDRFG